MYLLGIYFFIYIKEGLGLQEMVTITMLLMLNIKG
jgi:hypothetical protein